MFCQPVIAPTTSNRRRFLHWFRVDAAAAICAVFSIPFSIAIASPLSRCCRLVSTFDLSKDEVSTCFDQRFQWYVSINVMNADPSPSIGGLICQVSFAPSSCFDAF